MLNHYKDGKFHKVYDRLETTKSLVRFMHDPTGDRPWEEETAGKSVVHLDNPSVSLFDDYRFYIRLGTWDKN